MVDRVKDNDHELSLAQIRINKYLCMNTNLSDYCSV